MQDEFKIEGLVSVDCKACGKRTSLPALHVEPGVKCEHCGVTLTLNAWDYAAKNVILEAAGGREDVSIG